MKKDIITRVDKVATEAVVIIKIEIKGENKIRKKEKITMSNMSNNKLTRKKLLKMSGIKLKIQRFRMTKRSTSVVLNEEEIEIIKEEAIEKIGDKEEKVNIMISLTIEDPEVETKEIEMKEMTGMKEIKIEIRILSTSERMRLAVKK